MQAQTAGSRVDLLDAILRFEGGEMPQEELLPFFQELVNTGMAWKLQGSYGRTASELLQAGYIHPRPNA